MIFVKKFQIFLKFILRKSEPRSNVVRCSRLFLDHAKKRNFLKGLPHNICPKIQNYLLLFLGLNQPRNNVSQCSRLKKTISNY